MIINRWLAPLLLLAQDESNRSTSTGCFAAVLCFSCSVCSFVCWLQWRVVEMKELGLLNESNETMRGGSQ